MSYLDKSVNEQGKQCGQHVFSDEGQKR